jgi:hypothetical protein
MSAEVEGHQGEQVEKQVEIRAIQDEHIKP